MQLAFSQYSKQQLFFNYRTAEKTQTISDSQKCIQSKAIKSRKSAFCCRLFTSTLITLYRKCVFVLFQSNQRQSFLLILIPLSLLSVKPENVQLTVNDSNICQSGVISLNCSADANPAVHTYQLFENDALVSNSSRPIVWSKSASSGGVFVYRCEANNTVGTANSTTTVTVNGQKNIFTFS